MIFFICKNLFNLNQTKTVHVNNNNVKVNY